MFSIHTRCVKWDSRHAQRRHRSAADTQMPQIDELRSMHENEEKAHEETRRDTDRMRQALMEQAVAVGGGGGGESFTDSGNGDDSDSADDYSKETQLLRDELECSHAKIEELSAQRNKLLGSQERCNARLQVRSRASETMKNRE